MLTKRPASDAGNRPGAGSQLETLLQQGIAACKARDLPRARQLLTAALAIDPQNENAWLWLGGVQDDPAHRRSCLEKVLAINPNNARAQQALQALNAQEPPPAKKTPRLSAALTCPWCDAPTGYRRTRTCPECDGPLTFNCPECEHAVSLTETHCPQCGYAMGVFQQRQTYLRRLGNVYYQKGWAEQALLAYGYLADLEPDDVALHLCLAELCERLGHIEYSVAEAERVLELDPENLAALGRLGRWYLKSSQPGRLDELVQRFTPLSETSIECALLLGDFEYERNQSAPAFRTYRRVLEMGELTPADAARVHYRLGELYMLADDHRLALQAYEASVATGVADPNVEAARREIELIRPALPQHALRRRVETLRAMAGPLLFVVLTGTLQLGFRFRSFTLAGGLGLLAALAGSYLMASATSTPLAPEWQEALGPQGLTRPLPRRIVAGLGGGLWLASVGLVLFGM